MAGEQSFSSDVSPLSLKELIYCGWCKENLSLSTKLVQFECLHHGCISCLTSNLQDLRQGTLFSCPKCDLSCMVPLGGVDHFQEEPLLVKMKAIADIHANNHPTCQYCQQLHQSRDSSHVCVTCKAYLCEDDAMRHSFQPDHKTVTLEQLQTEPNISLMIQTKADLCQKHSSEKKYFCKDCEEQICMDCVVLEHNIHQKIGVEDAASGQKKKLEAEVKKLEIAEQEIKEKIKKSFKELNDIQQKLREGLENHGREGQQKKSPENLKISEMTKRGRTQRDNVSANSQILLRKVAQYQMAQHYIKAFLKYSANADIVQKCQFFVEVVADCLTSIEFRSNNYNMNEDSSHDMSTKLEDSSAVLSPLTKLQKSLETPIPSDLEDKGRSTVPQLEESNISSFILEAKWEAEAYNGIVVDGQDLLVYGTGKTIEKYHMNGEKIENIKCPELDACCSVDVYNQEIYISDTGNKKRNILVMNRNGEVTRKIELPTKEHVGVSRDIKLAVDKKNGDIMVGSNKRSMVYKIPAGETKVIEWVKDGISILKNICVTSGSEIIASCYTKVCKYDSNGKLSWTYDKMSSGEGYLKKIAGVCADQYSQVFVAEPKNHRIHVVSPHGQFLGYVDIGEEILSPQAIAYKDGRLFITTNMRNTVYVIKCNYK